MSDEASDQTSASALKFAHLVGRLKTTPRTGWVRRGVPRYESVADHSWRVAALSLLLTNVDHNKCMAMALLHDVAECIVGDIAPDDNVSKEEKRRMEHEAVNHLSQLLEKALVDGSREGSAESSGGDLFRELLDEYEERASREAIAVKDLDLLDMIIQADEYEKAFGLDLSDFFEGTPVARFRNEEVKFIAGEVHRARETRHKSRRSFESDKGLSNADMAFIDEFEKASKQDRQSIESVVSALRHFESR